MGWKGKMGKKKGLMHNNGHVRCFPGNREWEVYCWPQCAERKRLCLLVTCWVRMQLNDTCHSLLMEVSSSKTMSSVIACISLHPDWLVNPMHQHQDLFRAESWSRTRQFQLSTDITLKFKPELCFSTYFHWNGFFSPSITYCCRVPVFSSATHKNLSPLG